MEETLQKLAEWKALPYQVINADKVADLVIDRTEQLAKETKIPLGVAHAVLLKNSWDIGEAKKALLEPGYLENTFLYDSAAASARLEEASQKTEFLCEVCYCDCDMNTECIMMPDCGHMLCTDCFPAYAQEKVMGADGVYARCPDKGCNLTVPPKIFKKILSDEDYSRYQQFIVKAFVELSYNAKNCIGAGCEYIIANKTDRDVDVECVCGAQFCFGCLEPPHPPIKCELLEKWNERTKDSKGELEAEMNAKWLNANSKKCPKCKVPIEKSYGCNWMTCHSCKHGFCWLCLGDEAAHPGRAGNHAA